MPELTIKTARLVMKKPFVITGHVFTTIAAVMVTIRDGDHVGRGEAEGVYYLKDEPAGIAETIEGLRAEVEGGLTRAALQERLPPGGARNALDCALWELEAARAGQPVWRLAGLESMRPLVTTLTAGADQPEAMAST